MVALEVLDRQLVEEELDRYLEATAWEWVCAIEALAECGFEELVSEVYKGLAQYLLGMLDEAVHHKRSDPVWIEIGHLTPEDRKVLEAALTLATGPRVQLSEAA